MSTENLVIDRRSKGQQTKQLTYLTPDFRRPKVLNNFLIQQTPMHIFNALTTPPQHKKAPREPNLINQQGNKTLNPPSILPRIITQKQIVDKFGIVTFFNNKRQLLV